MAALVRPRGKKDPEYWAIQYYDGRKKRYLTLGRMPRAEAEKKLREFEAMQTLGLAPLPDSTPGAPLLVDILREVYEPLIERKSPRTQEVEYRCLGHILRLLPGITVDQVTPARMERYKTQRLREGVRSRTINMELMALRRALRAADEQDYLPDGAPKITLLKMNDQRPPKFLTLEQALRLQEELVRRARKQIRAYPGVVATLMALHTGMRKGEVLTREVADLDWDRGAHGVIRIGSKPRIDWQVKTRKERAVPLTELLAAEIRSFLVWRGDDPGWLFRRGNQGRLYRIAEAAWRLCRKGPKTVQDLAAGTEHLRHFGNPDHPWSYTVARAIQKNRKMFRDFGFGKWIASSYHTPREPRRLQSFSGSLASACKATDLPRLHQHALRHCWATLAFAGGMDVRTVQELGGWSTPDIPLRIYTHISTETALLAVDKFPLGRLTTGELIPLYGRVSRSS
jgi:integrase